VDQERTRAEQAIAALESEWEAVLPLDVRLMPVEVDTIAGEAKAIIVEEGRAQRNSLRDTGMRQVLPAYNAPLVPTGLQTNAACPLSPPTVRFFRCSSPAASCAMRCAAAGACRFASGVGSV
jgi:hypothetical protein